MEREVYFRWIGLIVVTLVLTTICGISILKVAEGVSKELRPLNSLSVYDDSCYVYGDNIYFATMCMNYMEDSNNTNYNYNSLRVE